MWKINHLIHKKYNIIAKKQRLLFTSFTNDNYTFMLLTKFLDP